MRTRMWAPLVVSLFLVPLLAAQGEYGVINGIVTDVQGIALPGVTVTLTGPDTRSTVTNERGEFTFVRLRPGQYQIESTLAGFSTFRRSLTLAAGRTEQITIPMGVGALTETAVVTGETPVVDSQTTFRSLAPAQRVMGVAGGLPPRDRYVGPFNTEAYDHIEENRFRRVDTDPLSTFSIDVDTASYANVRRFLTDGGLPPPGAVRIEELINYFRFDYPEPSGRAPFSITTELTACPWNPKHRLALIGLQGRALDARDPASRNLVFLIDVSGSMMPADKLPLVRTAMRMLADVLT